MFDRNKNQKPVKPDAENLSQKPAVGISRNLATEKSGSNKNKLLPTPIGELISDFLTKNFQDIVDYGFTADIETQLDKIATGKLDRLKMLKSFYTPFAKTITAADSLDRFNSAKELGKDPKTHLKIYAKIGKNGEFIQLGDNEKTSGIKPRFMPLPEGKTIKTLTLEDALAQLELPSLPRPLGLATDGTELIATSGPFGPYLKAGNYNIPLKTEDPYTISLKTAEKLYELKKASIIADWGEIKILIGAYGPYIKGPGRRNNLKIPGDLDPKKITETQAKQLLLKKPKSPRKPKKSPKSRKKPKKS